VEKGKEAGVLGKMPFFLPGSCPKQKGGRPSGGRPARVPADDPGHGDGREMGQNDGGDKGVLLPFLPWAWVHCRGGLMGGGGLQAAVVGDGASGGGGELGREGEMVVEVRVSPGSGRPLFIGGIRRFRRGIF
jgi:hypothetical protein